MSKRKIFLLLLFIAVPLAVHAGAYEAGMDAYQNGDYSRALHQWKPLAQHGHAQAAYNLGFMHEFGYGVHASQVEAFNYYLRAAQLGHAQAQHTVAWMYERGKGVTADRAQAARWLEILANSISPENTAGPTASEMQALMEQLVSELIKADARYEAQKAAKPPAPPIELEASNQIS